MTYTDKGYTETEIIEALCMIQHICKQQIECENCPFGNEDAVCLLQDVGPEFWHIRKETVWRAFE